MTRLQHLLLAEGWGIHCRQTLQANREAPLHSSSSRQCRRREQQVQLSHQKQQQEQQLRGRMQRVPARVRKTQRPAKARQETLPVARRAVGVVGCVALGPFWVPRAQKWLSWGLRMSSITVSSAKSGFCGARKTKQRLTQHLAHPLPALAAATLQPSRVTLAAAHLLGPAGRGQQ